MKSLPLTGAILLIIFSFQVGAYDYIYDCPTCLPKSEFKFSDPPSTQYKSHSEQMRELEERHEAQLQMQYRMEMQTAEEARRLHHNYCNTITANDRAQQACFNSQW